jgi:hypothetical protein
LLVLLGYRRLLGMSDRLPSLRGVKY